MRVPIHLIPVFEVATLSLGNIAVFTITRSGRPHHVKFFAGDTWIFADALLGVIETPLTDDLTMVGKYSLWPL